MDKIYKILSEAYRMSKDHPVNSGNLVNPVKDEIAFGRLLTDRQRIKAATVTHIDIN